MSILEELNYARDPRVVARYAPRLDFDARAMTLTFKSEDGEGEEQLYVFPARFAVCDTCQGRGSHVNPSIDASGISGDDEFWCDDYDDETGESRYMRGDYDVNCYGCGGKRVVPVIDEENAEPTALTIYEEWRTENARYEAERAAERRMGC